MLEKRLRTRGHGHAPDLHRYRSLYFRGKVLAIILCLKNLEPPEEGKSIEFPRKHAILADCTTIEYTYIYTYIYLLLQILKEYILWGGYD